MGRIKFGMRENDMTWGTCGKLFLGKDRFFSARVEPAGGPARALKTLIERLMKEDVTTPEDILPVWRAEMTSTTELETQMCVLLADTAHLKSREVFFRAAVVVFSIGITISDTASDINATVLYLEEDSPYGMPLLIHLIVASVRARERGRRGGNARGGARLVA